LACLFGLNSETSMINWLVARQYNSKQEKTDFSVPLCNAYMTAHTAHGHLMHRSFTLVGCIFVCSHAHDSHRLRKSGERRPSNTPAPTQISLSKHECFLLTHRLSLKSSGSEFPDEKKPVLSRISFTVNAKSERILHHHLCFACSVAQNRF
jgi:hypothetical protein